MWQGLQGQLDQHLICYVEKDIFSTITNDDVIDLFKKMKDREGKLWNVSLVSLYFFLNDTYFLHYFFLTIVVNIICSFVHPLQKLQMKRSKVIILPIISGICKEVLFYDFAQPILATRYDFFRCNNNITCILLLFISLSAIIYVVAPL